MKLRRATLSATSPQDCCPPERTWGPPRACQGCGFTGQGSGSHSCPPRPCLGDRPSWTQRGSLPASPAGLSVPEAEPLCSPVGPKREWATSSESPSSREDPDQPGSQGGPSGDWASIPSECQEEGVQASWREPEEQSRACPLRTSKRRARCSS